MKQDLLEETWEFIRKAQEEDPDAEPEELRERLEYHMDLCQCSDPCCPCTGIKRGQP